MKFRSTLFLFFVFCFYTSVFTAQTSINQLDADGKRHGVWKKKFPQSKQVRYEGTFEHGKEVGEFKFYCEECKNIPSTIITYDRTSSISEVKYFTIKGKLVSEGKMDDKDRTGEWVFYHEKSKAPMSKENYQKGKLHGLVATYYLNGKITEEKNYVMGILEGSNNYYSPEGVMLKKLNYTNDQLHGPAFYYDANGNITIEGNYKSGKKHGLWKYHKNGKVVLEETFPKETPKVP